MLLVRNNVQSAGHYHKLNTNRVVVCPSLRGLFSNNDQLNGHRLAYCIAAYQINKDIDMKH